MEQKGRKRKTRWYANDMLINVGSSQKTLGFLGPSGTSLRAFQGIQRCNLGRPGQVECLWFVSAEFAFCLEGQELSEKLGDGSVQSKGGRGYCIADANGGTWGCRGRRKGQRVRERGERNLRRGVKDNRKKSSSNKTTNRPNIYNIIYV